MRRNLHVDLLALERSAADGACARSSPIIARSGAPGRGVHERREVVRTHVEQRPRAPFVEDLRVAGASASGPGDNMKAFAASGSPIVARIDDRGRSATGAEKRVGRTTDAQPCSGAPPHQGLRPSLRSTRQGLFAVAGFTGVEWPRGDGYVRRRERQVDDDVHVRMASKSSTVQRSRIHGARPRPWPGRDRRRRRPRDPMGNP